MTGETANQRAPRRHRPLTALRGRGIGACATRPVLVAGVVFVLMCLGTAARPDDWYGRLDIGGEVRVDAETNKATLYRGGVATPLWDGTHHLQDGSVLIIRSGQAVPRTDIIEARRRLPQPKQPEWLGRPIVGYSPCEKLVRRVCGAENECAEVDACSPARQLMHMEAQERAASVNPSLMTFSSGQCESALHDRDYFATCTR